MSAGGRGGSRVSGASMVGGMRARQHDEGSTLGGTMMPSCPPTSLGGQVMLCSAVQRERSGKRQRKNAGSAESTWSAGLVTDSGAELGVAALGGGAGVGVAALGGGAGVGVAALIGLRRIVRRDLWAELTTCSVLRGGGGRLKAEACLSSHGSLW
eukprot:scaffold36267_cov58-Phaeocystis_antarctica.AAC.3